MEILCEKKCVVQITFDFFFHYDPWYFFFHKSFWFSVNIYILLSTFFWPQYWSFIDEHKRTTIIAYWNWFIPLFCQQEYKCLQFAHNYTLHCLCYAEEEKKNVTINFYFLGNILGKTFYSNESDVIIPTTRLGFHFIAAGVFIFSLLLCVTFKWQIIK